MDGEQPHDPANVEAGWEIRQDEASGQAYYWNAITGETSWEPPPHLVSVEDLSGAVNIAHPWTQAFDDSGLVYYVNTETMETRWAPPAEHQEDTPISEDPSVLTTMGGRGKRPSTAEQMDELNRLLSGGGEDEEDSPEGINSDADHPETNEMTPPDLDKTTEKPASDGEACLWMMFVNEDDGIPYYYNHITGECLWEPPEEFLRFHQELQQQDQRQQGGPEEITVAGTTAETPAQTASQYSTHAAEDIVDPKSEAGSTANSARLSNAAMQAAITPEFEEKVRQAIAAVSNTPVSSSRLVLVRTPTQQQLAPRTSRSAGDGVSARSGSNSSGPSRPSSGRAMSRPRTPSGIVISSTRDTIPPAAEILEEEMSASAVETKLQGEVEVIPADEFSAPNNDDDEIQLSLSVQATSAEECEETENIGGTENENESNIVLAPMTETEANQSEGEIGSLSIEEAPLCSEASNNLEGGNGVDAEPQGLSHVTGEGDAADTDSVDAEATQAEAKVELLEPVSIQQRAQVAALTLQCMARCFIARQRVAHKREERQSADRPVAIEISPERMSTTAVADAFIVITETEDEAAVALPTISSQEDPNEVGPSPQSIVSAPISTPEDVNSNGDSSAVVPLHIEQLPLHISARNDATEVDGSAEAPSSARPAVPSVQGHRRLSVITPALEQCPRRDRASISTRLPSILDVTKYFPQQRTVNSRLGHATGTADASEAVAITRKKVDIGSPPRARRASQQEAERIQADHEQLLETRRKEEERSQHAQVLEYQCLYTGSRRAFKAEKQRLLDEKLVRDNQRDRDAEVETHARIQAQHERDAARNRSAGNEADRLVWDHLKTQGRPTEQSVGQFRGALTQALDAAHFPNTMCAERARELHERIDRLHRASWVVDSQLEGVELALLSELHPLTGQQRPLQAKYAVKLRCRLEQMLNTAQSWQRVLAEWEASKENGSTSTYWAIIQARYASSSASYTSDESRRQYVLNVWRGAAGDSLLHVAAWNGWEEHVRLLIEEGADVNLIDFSVSRRTPLHEACRAGHAPIVVQLLRSGAQLSAVDASGDSALHVACRGGWTRVVRILLMAANDLGEETDSSSLEEETPLTLETFFNLRNGKGRRAIEVVTLPSLMEELESKWRL